MENCNALSYNIMQVIVGLVQAKAELELDLFPAHVCLQVPVNFCAEQSAQWFACKKNYFPSWGFLLGFYHPEI